MDRNNQWNSLHFSLRTKGKRKGDGEGKKKGKNRETPSTYTSGDVKYAPYKIEILTTNSKGYRLWLIRECGYQYYGYLWKATVVMYK